MFGGEASEKRVKVLSGGERSRLAMIRLLLEPVNLLILDEPTNHLDMASKDVLKEAIKAFDGTAIIVSHDREFLDGLVTKVYAFGDGKVKEHLGGIYDFLQSKQISELSQLGAAKKTSTSSSSSSSGSSSLNSSSSLSGSTDSNSMAGATGGSSDYAQRKEQQKQLKKAERAVEDSEKKISKMEQRLKELDTLLCDPKNASDMTLVTEYTDTKRALDEEVERWEKLSEELEELTL
jgi:ATP-binding cassette subfamily F protein 3